MAPRAGADPRRGGIAGLIVAGLAGLLPGPASADTFPAKSLAKPFFVADVVAVPAEAGVLEVTISWEIPAPELAFREEHGYFRARYDVSAVFRRGGKQIGGDVWERRVRLESFAETRDPAELVRGRRRVRLSTGDFDARIEVRDRQTGSAARVEGRVEGDPADTRIGLGDLRLVRYTEEGVLANPEGELRIGESGHRARLTLRVAEDGPETVDLVWRVLGPDGPVVEADSSLEVRDRESVVELPLDLEDPQPGRHRLEVRLKAGPDDPRTLDLWLLLTADWFVEHREQTLEILGIVAPGGVRELREAEGEAEWKRALEDFWRKRGQEPKTPGNVSRLEVQARIESASRFLEPFRRPGWRTERGKVMLEHGEPARRSVRPGSEEVPPSELWEYDEPRRQFLFVDLRGTGEYWLDR